jgi:aminoglycoside 2''-phosphotransferase
MAPRERQRLEAMLQSQARYLDSIRQAYPELAITSVESHEGGQNNDVLVIDGEWVFRFPRYPEALARLQVETAILRAIEPYVALEIPVPAYVGLAGRVAAAAPEGAVAFTGYRRIPGEPLWRETFAAIAEEGMLAALAAQLGGFLRALHAVPLAALGAEAPRADTYETCADIYRRMRQKLFPHMRPAARRWAAAHFERFLGHAANFEYEPVLKHGDFGPSNILFDRQAGRVQGILDFGNSCLGDPAYDFAGLLSGYGEAFVRRCALVYPAVEDFLPRVHFYQGTFALLEALFGVEHGDDDAYRAGMARYV